MSDKLTPKLATLSSMVITKLIIQAGAAPTEDQNVEMSMVVNAEVSSGINNDRARKMALDVSVSNDGNVYYSVEARAEAVFLFDDEASPDYIAEYLGEYAPNEAMAAVVASLKAATASFPYGSIMLPSFNVKLDADTFRQS